VVKTGKSKPEMVAVLEELEPELVRAGPKFSSTSRGRAEEGETLGNELQVYDGMVSTGSSDAGESVV